MEDRRCHKYKHLQKKPDLNYQNRFRKKYLKPLTKIPSLIIKTTIWDDIISEDREFENAVRRQKLENIPTFKCASGYLQEELFDQLVPAFERICAITLKKCAHCHPVRFFNFIDALAEYLYNTNQRYMERKENWKSVHRIYENKERTFYPYFWFLSLDEAATIIQAVVRGFLVRRRIDLKRNKENKHSSKESLEIKTKLESLS